MPIQQIFDLLYYDAEQHSAQTEQHGTPKKITYEEALHMAKYGVPNG